jgi:hypothetical protein
MRASLEDPRCYDFRNRASVKISNGSEIFNVDYRKKERRIHG